MDLGTAGPWKEVAASPWQDLELVCPEGSSLMSGKKEQPCCSQTEGSCLPKHLFLTLGSSKTKKLKPQPFHPPFFFLLCSVAVLYLTKQILLVLGTLICSGLDTKICC